MGAFQLNYNSDQEIDLFEWCGTAVKSTSDTNDELSSLKSRFKEQQETINKLNTQLDDLITAKAQHENELLEKFRDLLNEKKSKIRDQQRLLAAAKVDPKKLAELDSSRVPDTRTAGPSRSNKRKAGNKSDAQAVEDEDTDDGFELMDVDVDQVPNDSEQEDAQTPEAEETATEDDEDDTPPVKPPARSKRQPRAAKSKAATKGNAKTTGSKGTKADVEEDSPKTPPRRDLPFAKKKAPPAKKTPTEDADRDTASEDDEL
jgi:myosin heavy subunit